jgi:Restriction endonuclease fold toxin 5
MAALPLVLLEKAGEALIAALAATTVVVGGAVVSEEVKRRSKESDKAKDKPVAKTSENTKAKEKKACDKCPPDCGALLERSIVSMGEPSADYQQRICQMPPARPGYLNEWEWQACEFDGFDSSLCNLKEAKGNYDQFFDAMGKPATPFADFMLVKMLRQAQRQCDAIRASPNVSLTWFFQTPIVYRIMAPKIMPMGAVVLHVP